MRRALRWARNALLGVLGLVVLVLGGVQLALLTAPGREYVRARVVPLLSDALDAQLTIARIDALSPFGLRASAVQLRDANGVLVASLGKLDAGFEPFELVGGKVHVTHLALDDAFVALGAPLDEGGGLLGVFVKPDAKKDEDSGGGPDIALDGIALRGGHVQVKLNGAQWEARGLTLNGGIAVGDALALRIARLGGQLLRDGKAIGALEGGAGNYGAAEHSDVRLALRIGRSTLRVRAKLGEPDGAGAQPVEVALSARAIDTDTLVALGVQDEILRAPVDLQLNGHGTTRALDASLALMTEAGTVNVDGRWQAPLSASATLRTSGFVPARVFAVEADPCAGTLELQVERAEGGRETTLALTVRDARYGALPLPHTTSQGRFIEGQGLRIERLDARAPGVSVNAHGTVGVDGALGLTARIDGPALAQEPALARLVPGLAGALTADLSFERSAAGAVDGRIDARLARGALGSARVQSLHVTGRARGAALDRVQAALQLNTTGVQAGPAVFQRTQLALKGGPDRFEVAGSFDDQGSIRASAQRADRHWTINGSLDLPLATARAALSLPRRPPPRVPFAITEGAPAAVVISILHANVQSLELESGGAMSVRRVELAYQDARVVLAGQIDANERAKLEASVVVPHLQAPSALVMDPPLHGSLQASVRASGPLRTPQVELDAKYRCDQLEGLHHVALEVRVNADLRERLVQAKTQLSADGAGAKLALEARLKSLSEAGLRAAQAKISLDVDRFPLHALTFWPKAPAVPRQVVLAGTFNAEGTIDDYAFDSALRASVQFVEHDAPLQASLDAKYDKQRIELKLRASDQQGPLIRTAIRTDLSGPIVPLDRASFERLIAQRGWDVSLWLGARRIDALPSTRALGVPEALWPARVSMNVKLEHRPGSEPTGQLHARAAWDPPGKETQAPMCGLSRSPFITLEAGIGDGKLHGEFVAGAGGKDGLAISVSSNSPIDEWLHVDPERVQPLQANARFLDLELGDLPVVCEQVRGKVAGSAELARALTRAVTVNAKLQGKKLTFMDSEPIDVALDASARGDQVIGNGVLTARGGRAELFAQIPLDGGGRMPSVRSDAPLRIDARFKQIPAPALMASVPGVYASSGAIGGWVGLRGSMVDPQVRGRIDLHDVTMTLGELGQRFERANGTLTIEGRKLTLSHLRFADLGGRADLSGELNLRTLDPFAFDAKLEAKAKQLPVRRGGVLAAHLDGTIGAQIHVAPDRIDVLATLRKARIELADAATSEPQSLADNPDIVFSDEPVKVAEEETATPVRIRIDASQPFWVRRSDFSALVTANLTIESGAGAPSVVGKVTMQRGVIELLGQLFDIERGTIEFAGGHAIEPTLDVAATRKIPGSSGAVVRVEAHGSVHAPELTFEVDGEPATAGDALAAALGTKTSPGGDSDVQQELSSVATGVAGSVLTLAVRRELGPWVPVLALERGAGETRVRAGVEADRFIPSFLRKVVVDAYVEGIVSSQEQTENGKVTDDSNSGAAVLLDLRFPHDLNTEAQYGPGQRWSLDFGWEP